MDARTTNAILRAAVGPRRLSTRPLGGFIFPLCLLAILCTWTYRDSGIVFAASARTQNFVVTAATPDLASEIAEAAESFRQRLAVEWLGQDLPPWNQPCPIVADVNPSLGAGGRTSFAFRNRTPSDWYMEIQGSRERILDSVLPHEVTHTVFATHYGRPLPRWADEGACTTVEHRSERRKQELWLIEFLKTERGIPFNRMFAMTEYPGDILPLYSQGYSVARYMIAQGGKPKFVDFVEQGLDTGDWPTAVEQYYGFASLGDLQVSWLDWVIDGSRDIDATIAPGTRLVSTQQREIPRRPQPEVSGRNPVRVAALTHRDAIDGEPQSWYARRERTDDSQGVRGVPHASQSGTNQRRAAKPLPADGWRSTSY